MNSRVWGAVAVASLAFGTGAVATRGALRSGMEPYTVAALRALLAAVLVVVILSATGRMISRSWPVLWIGLVLSVANFAVPFVAFTVALQYASAGFVGLVTALFPLASALFAHFLLPDEPLTLVKTGGLVTALAGVAVLLLSGDSGLAAGGRSGAAVTLSLIGVIGIGYSNVYGRRHAEEYEPLQITGLQFAFGTVWLTAAMLFIDGVPRGIVAETWALIGYLAVVSTVVAFFLLFWLLRHSSAATASLVGYLVPLVAVFAGLAFLDERLQPGILVGGALILAGVVLTEQAPGSPRP